MGLLPVTYASELAVNESVGDIAERVAPSSFTQNFSDQLGYFYQPIIRQSEEALMFAGKEDASFNFVNALSELDDDFIINHAADLVGSQSKEQFDYRINTIKENQLRRQRMETKSWYSPSSLLAGLIDPLNIAFAIPFIGTPLGTIVKGGMGVKAAAAAGAKGGFYSAVAGEAIRYPFDDLATPGEAATNIAATTLFSSLISSAPSAFRSAKPVVQQAAKKFRDYKSGVRVGDTVDMFDEAPITRDDVAGQQGETIVVFDAAGNSYDAPVVARSEAGSVIVRNQDGQEVVLDSDLSAQTRDILDENFEFQSKGVQGRKLKDIADDEIDEIIKKLESLVEQFKTSTAIGGGLTSPSGRAAITDLNALKNKKNPKPKQRVDPATKQDSSAPKTAKVVRGKVPQDPGRDDYVAAKFKGEEGKIYWDEEYLLNNWKDKPWSKPRVEGVEPLPDFYFQTPEEWARFVLYHEMRHARSARGADETVPQYENRMNREALQMLAEGKDVKPNVLNWILKTPFYKNSPSLRQLLNKKTPATVKMMFANLTNNASVTLQGNVPDVKYGFNNQSLQARAFLGELMGEQLYDDLQRAFSRYIKDDVTAERSKLPIVDQDIDPAVNAVERAFGETDKMSFPEFVDMMLERRIRFEDPEFAANNTKTDIEQDLFNALDKKMEQMGIYLSDTGAIVNAAQADPIVKSLNTRINEIKNQLDKYNDIPEDAQLTKNELNHIASLKNELNYKQDELTYFEGIVREGRAKPNFVVTIRFDQAKLATEEQQQGLINILAKHYRENPLTQFWDAKNKRWGRYVPKADIAAIRALNKKAGITESLRELDPDKAARETVNDIISGKVDDELLDVSNGVPKDDIYFIRRRTLDIPEYKIVDYLRTDMQGMMEYFSQTGRRAEWARVFGRQSLDDLLGIIETEGRLNGNTDKEIAAMKADFTTDVERIFRVQIQDPTALNTRIANALRKITSMTYLPATAVASVSELGIFVLERGLLKNIAPLIDTANYPLLTKARKDQAKMLYGMELAANMDFITRRIDGDHLITKNETMIEKGLERMQGLYFNSPFGNFLGAFTKQLRLLNAVMQADEIAEIAIKVAKNEKIDARDAEKMSRLGLELEDLQAIGNLKKQTGEDIIESQKLSVGRFHLLNMSEWPVDTPAQRDLKRKVQTAINLQTQNTILMSQAMDRPAAMDGVIYFQRSALTDKLGLKVDARMSTGDVEMVRFESGAMTLPYSLLSWTVAATSRLPLAMTDPARKYRMQGMLGMLGFAYLSLHIQKPDYWFDTKDKPELFQKIVERSGVLGVYADIYYMALQNMIAHGVVDKDNPYLQGRYNASKYDAATDPLGAPFGQVSELTEAITNLMTGDGDLTDIGEQLPFQGTPVVGGASSLLYGWVTGADQDAQAIVEAEQDLGRVFRNR